MTISLKHPFNAVKMLITSLALLLIAGCATVGQEFPSESVAFLRIGETTQAQVRDEFGSPWRIGVENGQRTWTYGRYRYSAFSAAKTKDLVIRFDNSGLVRSYTFNTTDHQE